MGNIQPSEELLFWLYHSDLSSIRSNRFWGYKRVDHNLFAPLATVAILKDILPKATTNLAKGRLKSLANAYQHHSGRPTYNFWPRNNPFPNGRILHKYSHFKLPDDIDDTALFHLVVGSPKETVQEVRQLAGHYSKGLPAYGTWFGENMPKEIDVCALCNLLLLFQEHGLEPTEEDTASYVYLANVISKEIINKEPFRLARHYARPALLYYHFARLMSRSEQAVLLRQKDSLVNQLNAFKGNTWDQVLVNSSLLRLGYQPKSSINKHSEEIYYPFIGAPLAPYTPKVPWFLASSPLFLLNWECEELMEAYFLEYLFFKSGRVLLKPV